MTPWTANSAISEIEEIIQEGGRCLDLRTAQAWKGKLEVWLRRICSVCPTELGSRLKPILEDLQRLNLATFISSEYGGWNVLMPEILDQCIGLAKVAREIISGLSEDSLANTPEQQGQPLVNTTHSCDLSARMLGAGNRVGHTQAQAAECCETVADGALEDTPERIAALFHQRDAGQFPQTPLDLAKANTKTTSFSGDNTLVGEECIRDNGIDRASRGESVGALSAGGDQRQAVESAQMPPAQEPQGPRESRKAKKPVRRNQKYKTIDQALQEIAESRPSTQEEVFTALEGRVVFPPAQPFETAGGWMRGFRRDPAAARAWLSKRWAELGLPPLPRGPKNLKK